MKKLYFLLLFVVCAGYAQQQPFITTWEVQSGNMTITIPVYDSNNNYTVDFGDGTVLNNQSGQVTYEYSDPGIYTVSLSGNLGRIYSDGNTDTTYKLKTIEQWGDIVWTSMESAFKGCLEMVINATDSPNLSQVSNMSYMFSSCNLISSNISNWDTSNVTDMSYMFHGSAFNLNISDWDVSNVTNMSYMFDSAYNFNQSLNNWDVSNVSNMSYMFNYATAFNQPLNAWNVSNVTNMSSMFSRTFTFNQPLDNWNVSNVITTEDMFYQAAEFNQPLDNWNVSHVINMRQMFRNSAFNQSLNGWDVSNVTDMYSMFADAWNFNSAVDEWDVGSVTNMEAMFSHTPFNQPLNSWNVSNVTNMKQLFDSCLFNQPLNNWNVSNVTNMSQMFLWCPFNQNIENWDVGNVTDMSHIFTWNVNFNQPIENWDVSSVINMSYMFSGASAFNQPIENWDVSAVTNMEGTFNGAMVFNQSLENWDVSNVIQMGNMFSSAKAFNQPLNGWNVSNVIDMSSMFAGMEVFNQPLNNWDVSNVIDMSSMFASVEVFNQSLDNWDVSNVIDMKSMFKDAVQFNQDISNWNFNSNVIFTNPTGNAHRFLSGSGLNTDNYDALLLKFVQLELQNKRIHADGLKYCDVDVYSHLINELGWTIIGGSLGEECEGNNVTGTMLIDENLNGCETNDAPAVNFMVQATNGTYNYGTFVNATGNYDLRVQEDTYTVAPVNVPEYFTVTPPTAEVTFTGFGNSQSLNFCLVPNQSVQDLNVTILPIGDARPGFESQYKILIENIGTQSVSNASVSLGFDNILQSFVSATPAPATTSANQLTFNVGNLGVFETKEIDFTMTTFVPPVVNGGEVAAFTANVTPDAGDNTPDDNTFVLNQTIVNSFDPNDKRVVQGDEIYMEQTGEYLDYIIRFQNTGTASAITVRVEDTLSDNLDWATLKPIAASHSYRVEVTEGNKVNFIFDNINLPHEAADAPGSNGYIAYKVKPKQGIQLGDVIAGNAGIYFDFNLPIITNTVTTTVVEPLGVKQSTKAAVSVYPNPAGDLVYLQAQAGTQVQQVSVYNLQGSELMSVNQNQNPQTLNISSLSAGVYLLQVQTNTGRATYRLVKK